MQFWQYGAAGMWNDRCVQLHDNTGDNAGQEPDIIVVYMGTNDFKWVEAVKNKANIGAESLVGENGEPITPNLGSYADTMAKVEAGTLTADSIPETTMDAYWVSFTKMAARYPDSELYVMGLLPFKAGKEQPNAFNDDIELMAKEFNATFVDLESIGIESDAKSFEYLMEDWLHPNLKGMEVVSNAFVSAIREHSKLVDSSDNVAVSYTLDGVTALEGTRRVATKGDKFEANLKLKDTSALLQVTVTMVDADGKANDITAACCTKNYNMSERYGEVGHVSIPEVTGAITITAVGHKHDYSYSVVVTDPTCLEQGYTTKTCACGDFTVENYIGALGHSFTNKASETQVSEATCTKAAVYKVQCDRCDAVSDNEKNVVSVGNANGHKYDKKQPSGEVATSETCTVDRTEYVKCDVCGTVDKTQAPVAITGTATGHKFNEKPGTLKSSATCTAKAVYWVQCDHCDVVSSDEKDVVSVGELKAHTMRTVSANEAKCESTGNNLYYQCTACEGYFKDINGTTKTTVEDETIAARDHDLEHHASKAAECTEAGNTEYWQCKNCSKVFSDEDGQNSTTLTAVTIKAAGHAPTKTEAKTAKCEQTGNKAYWTCGTCGKVFSDAACTKETTVEAMTIAATGHQNLTEVKAKDAKCTEDGNKQYWECLDCGKLFADADAKTETTAAAVKLDKLAHKNKVHHQKVDAKCTEDGSIEYWSCPDCGTNYSDEACTKKVTSVTLAKLGHDFTDGHHAKVDAKCAEAGTVEYYHCSRCGNNYASKTSDTPLTDLTIPAKGHKTDLIPAKAAKCEDTGNNAYYYCSACRSYFKDADGETATTTADETISATGHDFDDTVYSWTKDASGVWSCTATHKCKNTGCSKSESVKAEKVESDVDTPATCEKMGKTLYTATFAEKDSSWTATQTQTVEDISANGHTFGDTTYAWSKDYKSCTATRKCSVKTCGHEETASAKLVSRAETKAAKCEETGEATYTATFDAKDSWAKTATTVETLAAKGHSYGEVSYTWNKDYTECTATHTCRIGSCGKSESATTKNIQSVVVEAKCTADGKATYTATFTGDDSWAGKTVKEIVLTQLNHDYGATTYSWSWDADKQEWIEGVKSCTATRKCKNCDDEQSVNASQISSTQSTAPKCETKGENTYTASFGVEWTQTQTAAIADIPAAGHSPTPDLKREPTCSEVGRTEGSHCLVCGDVLVPQQDIPMKPHDVLTFEGRNPTYTDVGYKAYETCKYCSHTTYQSIPALGAPSIETFEEFMEALPWLEQWAVDYASVNAGKDPIDLVIKYIRTGVDRYNSGSWGIMAGYEDSGFAEYVKSRENEINRAADSIADYIKVTGLKDVSEFTLPNGDKTDFGHMFGTMDISYNNKGSVDHADVGGWAGDLVDLMTASDRAYNNSDESTVHFALTEDVEKMVEQIGESIFLKITCEDDKFSESDFFGDMDALYLIQNLYKLEEYAAGDMTDILRARCTASLTNTDRAEFFVSSRLGGSGTRAQMRETIYNAFTANMTISTLETTRDFLNNDPAYLNRLRRAVCYTFADYICRLAGDYVDVDSNPY